MEKDFGRKLTVYVNGQSLDNFALGFDFYKLYEYESLLTRASILQLNFLFFNITLTFWKEGLR